MSARQVSTSNTVLRPSVVASIPWGGLCGIWYIWVVLTTQYPKIGEPPFLRLMSSPEFLAGTAVNLALLVWLGIDGWVSRSSPPGVRRGHLAGVVLAAVLIVLLQTAFLTAVEPIDVSVFFAGK